MEISTRSPHQLTVAIEFTVLLAAPMVMTRHVQSECLALLMLAQDLTARHTAHVASQVPHRFSIVGYGARSGGAFLPLRSTWSILTSVSKAASNFALSFSHP